MKSKNGLFWDTPLRRRSGFESEPLVLPPGPEPEDWDRLTGRPLLQLVPSSALSEKR